MVIQCVRILHVANGTLIAIRQVKFVIARNAVQEIPGPLETNVRLLVQQQIRFIGAAQSVTKLDIRSRPARVNMIVLVDSHQESCTEQGDQRSGLQLIGRAFDVARHLPW